MPVAPNRTLSSSEVQGIVDEAKEKVRGEIVGSVVKWSIALVVAILGFAAIGLWGIFLPWLRTELGGAPRGAVVAFDRDDLSAEKCPEGWDPFLFARGRFILGAGDPAVAPRKYGFDAAAAPLIEYSLRQHGGYQEVRLQVPHMPPHDHGGKVEVDSSTNEWRQSDAPSGYPVIGGFGIGNDHAIRDNPHDHIIASQGKGAAHPNMPPFLALYYCKRS